MSWYRAPQTVIDAIAREEQAEPERRERRYRAGHVPAKFEGRVVVLVDDGLPTGSTMEAAVEAVRLPAAVRIVGAVPVGSPETCQEVADEIVRAHAPDRFAAVGQWYGDCSHTTDEEVRDLLHQASQTAARER